MRWAAMPRKFAASEVFKVTLDEKINDKVAEYLKG